MLFVLNLGFGQRGLVVDAPVDRPEAFIDEVFLEEVVERLDDAGLVAVGHREVGVIPAAKDADALELTPLEVDVLLRILAAGASDGEGGHLEFLAAELLVHFDFNRETVAVPARNIRGVEARHRFGLDDEVLDAFIQGVAEMDGSIGVRRPIVEDIFRCPGAGNADLGIQMLLLPRRKAFGLIVRQISLHGKGGLRQVQRGFQQLSALGRSFGCFRHSFLVLVVAEAQFAPNSYCRRGGGGTNRAVETFLGGCASKITSIGG